MKYPNGTQAQLDAARDDAMLIPMRTRFLNRDGLPVHRADSEHDDARSVHFVFAQADDDARDLDATDLEPIND